jgi:phosphoglycerate kinase
MFSKKTIKDIDIKDKKVIIRVDFNVPLNDHGVITDDYRIKMALPTIEYAKSQGAKIILISHLGRPTGPSDGSCSLAPCATRLSELLHSQVSFVKDCIGADVQAAIDSLQPGDCLLLENLRFHKEEEANDPSFAKKLASLGDVFVQDGFGVVHRAHASTEGITHYIPSVAGLLLEKEVTNITNAMTNPDRPLSIVIGGAKVSDKIELLDVFIQKADYVAVVGAMANTFLMIENIPIGLSKAEHDVLESAKLLYNKAQERMRREQFTFYLPHDVVVAKSMDNTVPTRVVDISSHAYSDIAAYPKIPEPSSYTVQPDEYILDIGPMTASSIAGAMKLSGTAVWNGTAGVTEVKGINGAADPFSHGTKLIIEGLVGEHPRDDNKPFTIVGGGDTVGFVESVPWLRERLNHVSTGGGASLELMSGKKLPGLDALQDNDSTVPRSEPSNGII